MAPNATVEVDGHSLLLNDLVLNSKKKQQQNGPAKLELAKDEKKLLAIGWFRNSPQNPNAQPG